MTDRLNNLQRLVKRLRRYNDWRRGADFEQPEPDAIGRDIDDTIATIEQHIALISKYDAVHSALEALVNEQQPLGINRPTYQRALKLIDT